MADPQADLTRTIIDVLTAEYVMDPVYIAEKLLAALGDPHERVAELEVEVERLHHGKIVVNESTSDPALIERVGQLLRDLKAIEEMADTLFDAVDRGKYISLAEIRLIREAARQAQAPEIAATNADGVT